MSEPVTVLIDHGPTRRQTCLACRAETEKSPVQAFAFVAGDPVPVGAICERCLASGHAADTLPVCGTLPTLPTLEHARAVYDAWHYGEAPRRPS